MLSVFSNVFKFESHNNSIPLNVLFANNDKDKIKQTYISKHNSNSEKTK